jgi:hypothetical protein
VQFSLFSCYFIFLRPKCPPIEINTDIVNYELLELKSASALKFRLKLKMAYRDLPINICAHEGPEKTSLYFFLTLFPITKHFPYIYEDRLQKFVDSPYYSESELCGGAVTVSFSKYLPWQAMHLLQRSTHFSKTCCRTFAASFGRIVEQEVLTSELPFHGWKSPEIAWREF